MINKIKKKINNLKNRKNKTKYFLSYLIRNSFLRNLTGPIDRGDFIVHFHDSATSQMLWYNRNNRSKEINFIKKYLNRGDKYIDVGANIGVTTIPGAMKVGSEGGVFAFEAHPRVYSFMEENILLNNIKNIDKYNLALGSEKGKVGFTNMKKKDDQNFISDDGDIVVKKERLDDVCSNVKSVSLIKVDVEGAEMRVMIGADRIIEETNCVVMEFIDDSLNRYGDSAVDLNRFMNSKGFRLFNLKKEAISRINKIEGADYESVVAIRDVENFIDRTGYEIK